MYMELSFCELRIKVVVNVCDGKRLGNIIDLVFDSSCARITGIVVPSQKSFLSLFKNNSDIFIPYNRIRKIGKDVILVELTPIGVLSEDGTSKVAKTPQPLTYTETSDYSNTN